MPAAAIFFFARVTRAAMVGSLTRNARAISSVVRPHTRRSVSASWASRASAGWQHVKTSRRRSSSIVPAVPMLLLWSWLGLGLGLGLALALWLALWLGLRLALSVLPPTVVNGSSSASIDISDIS